MHAVQETSTAHAGWYPDPAGPSGTRYWDGEEWDGRPEGGGRWPDPQPEPPASTPDGQELAGWWVRVLAYVADRVVLLATTQVISVATVPLVGVWGCFVLSLLAVLAYGVGFLWWRQATPGKLLFGLRVRSRERPGPMPLGTVAVRWLVGVAPVLAASLVVDPWWVAAAGVLWLAVDSLSSLGGGRRQTLHDRVARTQVVLHGRWLGDAA